MHAAYLRRLLDFTPLPGASGLLIGSNPAASEVLLSWGPARSADSSSAANLKYELHYTLQGATVVMYSLCGLERGKNRDLVKIIALSAADSVPSSDSRIHYHLIDSSLAGDVTFSVVVKDGSHGDVAAVYHPYTLEMANPEPDASFEMVLIIGLPLLILAVIVIVYLALRNRKLSQELQVEMHDVPKSALAKAVRGPPSSQTEKYSQLLQLEDGFEDNIPAPPSAIDDQQDSGRSEVEYHLPPAPQL